MSLPSDNIKISDYEDSKGSLRNSFLLVLLPISIIFILLLGGMIYIRARKAISNQIRTQLSANLDSVEKDINTWLATRRIRLELAVRQLDLKTAIDPTLASFDSGILLSSDANRLITDELLQATRRGEQLLFNQFFIANSDGEIIIASQPEWIGYDISTHEFYISLFARIGTAVVYNQAPISEGEAGIITSVPIFNDQNMLRGTVFGLSGPISMISILENVSRFNPSAQSYLLTPSMDFIRVDPYQRVVTNEIPTADQRDDLGPMIKRLSLGLPLHGENIISTKTFNGNSVIAKFNWLPALNAGLVVEIPQEIAFGELNSIGPYVLIITITFVILLSTAIWATTQQLVAPLIDLTDATQKFSQGNWEQRAPEGQAGEIGRLSHAFNHMAGDLSVLYRSMEAQVISRTNLLTKRTQQLEASAEVAREAASIHNLDDLLSYAARLISEQFDFYHVGIFLLDNPRQFAVLQAANSLGGQRMLSRSHKLEIGKEGVVGYVAATGLPRIALDVGSDAYFFDNPDLPETRSELVLPLKIRDLVIGVLDVQSSKPAAFDEPDVEILQILSDQLALAIDNTKLFEQSQRVIIELQNAYQMQTRTGWLHWMMDRKKSYYYDRVHVKSASEDNIKAINKISTQTPHIKNDKDGSVLSVPLAVREQIIGSIILRRDPQLNPWTSSELSVVLNAINQVVAALDNARLLQETRLTAAREQIIGEITTKIRETLDIDTVAKSTAEELRKTLNLPKVTIQLGNVNRSDVSEPS
jgi:GAF domain-containing protein/HAMP domain-containing protein